MPNIATADHLTFEADGAQVFVAVANAGDLDLIDKALADQPEDRGGIRLFGVAGLYPVLRPDGFLGALAASVLGDQSRPVRAILFDKTSTSNWALGWHQDRVIAVAEHFDVEGLGPWTRKQGVLHVAPPFDILKRMITLRLHLDDVPTTNAPLLVAPGSHRLGRIAEVDVPDVVLRCGSVACTALAGDVWLYATPVLHASQAASTPSHRRVLQVDYSPDTLPGGLEWLGV